MPIVWWLVKTLVALVALTQLTCVVVALYEMLNLPATRHTRLTAGAVAAVARDSVVEMMAMLAALAMGIMAALPWRRIPYGGALDVPPLVFVPGYAATRACWWPLRRHLARAGWRHAVGYNYRTIGGDVRAAADGLGRLLDAVRAQSGAARVVVVAHGIGGIVARVCLRERTARDVLALMTLGTPHQGSKLFALALDPMLHVLRAGSTLIDELTEDDPLPGRIDLTSIYSNFDATVVPSAAAQYPGGSSIEIEGVGHFGLLWSRRVFELVRENLDFVREAQAVVPGPVVGDQAAASTAMQRATSPPSA